ncbi:MAG: hypothetical protein Q8L37_00225 [Candidatus Gottesmanbacteria bacterium]|nr:hypothetical protein [Candidatus Gottesmanbacteria bacterium]
MLSTISQEKLNPSVAAEAIDFAFQQIAKKFGEYDWLMRLNQRAQDIGFVLDDTNPESQFSYARISVNYSDEHNPTEINPIESRLHAAVAGILDPTQNGDPRKENVANETVTLTWFTTNLPGIVLMSKETYNPQQDNTLTYWSIRNKNSLDL